MRGPLPQNLKIAYSPDLGYAVVQSDIAGIVEEALEVFVKLGHKVEGIKGGPPLIGDDWNLIGSLETASRLHTLLPDHEEDFTYSFLAGVRRGWAMTPERWGEAAQKRNQVNNWCAETFNTFDLLITPTVPFDPPLARGPFPTETEGRRQVPAGSGSFTIPFNQSGHPAATVRAGMSKANLPVGLQIVGPRYREDLVLQIARAFEIERPWHPHWPTSW